MEYSGAGDEKTLIEFWDKAFQISEEEKKELRETGQDGWKELAPSGKLFAAAESLSGRKNVLDYGCGNAWAGIIAAKSGAVSVTAVDPAPGAIEAAGFFAGFYGVKERMKLLCAGTDWLKTVPSGTYDGLICSNVLDVIPPDSAKAILREAARITAPDAKVIIGLNFYLSPEAAEARGMKLEQGRRVYINGILRLVSLTDEEWEEAFSPYFAVERLEHFAWQGEAEEKRRLFHLKKR